MRDWNIIHDEWLKIHVDLLRISSRAATPSDRPDVTFPTTFIASVRRLHQALNACALPRACIQEWKLVETRCKDALRTVESYLRPGVEGQPLEAFKGKDMEAIVKWPETIQIIHAKVQAKLRADHAFQAPPPNAPRPRKRS